MKLEQAIITGRFCGLKTVEECINNIYHHYSQIFPYDVIDKEFSEMEQEYEQYVQGSLTPDWDYINSEVLRLENDFIAHCENASENEKNILTDNPF